MEPQLWPITEMIEELYPGVSGVAEAELDSEGKLQTWSRKHGLLCCRVVTDKDFFPAEQVGPQRTKAGVVCPVCWAVRQGTVGEKLEQHRRGKIVPGERGFQGRWL